MTRDRDVTSAGDTGNGSSTWRSPRRWRTVALLVGGAVATVTGTAVLTLVATHKSARHENAKAYANGFVDAIEGLGIDLTAYGDEYDDATE